MTFDRFRRPVNVHRAYHAHVYFDAETAASARELCDSVGKEFDLRVGGFHLEPVGPHPSGSCQITFGSRDFDALIPWLDANRHGLTILVHGLTGDVLRDHTEFAYWLGKGVELNLAIFELEK